ncbi:hypothetical protein FRB94_003754 [Tulasnella sp. JGI-2019a]|nr:hypothetical protein FRB94_003754 [Tulasnella sp. JGI-2019a]
MQPMEVPVFTGMDEGVDPREWKACFEIAMVKNDWDDKKAAKIFKTMRIHGSAG